MLHAEDLWHVSFSHLHTVTVFTSMNSVFLDKDQYINIFDNGDPGCGKSMSIKVAMDWLGGKMEYFTHESLQNYAVPGNTLCPEDEIRFVDEMTKEQLDPDSPQMKQLLSILTGGEFHSTFL